MKFYYPTDKNGNQIGFKTPESQVYDKNGVSLTDKLTELNSKLALLEGGEDMPSILDHYGTVASEEEYGHVKVNSGNGLSVTNGIIKMNEGSSSSKGALQVEIGNGLSVSSGVVSMDIGSTLSKGALQVTNGNGLSVTNGIISMSKGNASTLGSVKLSDIYDSSVSSGNAAGGLGASQNALYNAYNTLNTKLNNGIKIDSYNSDTSSLYLVDM